MPWSPSWRRGAAALLLVGVAAGCGWFDDPSPDEARVVVQGDGGVPVRIIVSEQFVAGRTQAGTTQVEVLVSDTFDVVPPFDRTFDIRDEGRFFTQVSPLEGQTDVRVRVLLDGRERYNDSGALTDAAPFRFVFLFNQFVTSNIEVI